MAADFSRASSVSLAHLFRRFIELLDTISVSLSRRRLST
jgi:hypothetical protein